MTTTPTETQLTDALRAWAKGIYPTEAAVELLIRSGLSSAGYPWVQRNLDSPDRWWVDADQINADTIGAYSGGQQRVLRIAAALLGAEPVDLFEDVPGLDREHLALVLAAIAHAGGSHEHSGELQPDPAGKWNLNGVRHGFRRLPSLYPWPEGE